MKKLLKITAICLVSVLLLSILTGTIYYFSVTSRTSLNKNLLPAVKSELVFTDDKGEKIDGITDTFISENEITENLKHAFIALEDKRFYNHKGVDYIRIFGALKANLKKGDYMQGGSTITQQLIKNTHLTHEKTLNRKLKEIKLARALEKQYSKDEILTMYMNVVYFGNGIYGVKNAAKIFFNKDINELKISECATLVAVLKNPSKYSPLNNMDNALKRRNLVLKLMAEQGYITEAERDASISEKIVLAKNNTYSYIQSYTLSALTEAAAILNMTPQALLSSGYTIKTHLNRDEQTYVYNIISNPNYYKANKNGIRGEGMAILIDNQNYGIKAFFSTKKRDVYEFRRQIGSTGKPILVYAPAFERGIVNAATPILDETTDFNGYKPSNYGDEYLGWIDTRTAIMKSSNIAAVKTYNALGFDNMKNFTSKLNIPISAEMDNNATVSLGNVYYGLNFIELSGAYSMLANYGEFATPSFIDEISNEKGKIIYNHEPKPIRVMNDDNAYIITDILMDTVKKGTARGLSNFNFQIASKTGTVGNEKYNTDAYNVCYTSKHTLAVWHGNSSGNSYNNLPLNETGGAYTTFSAKEILKNIYKNSKPADFTKPNSVIDLEIDTYAQRNKQKVMLASKNTPKEFRKIEVFSKTNYPTEISDCFNNFVVNNLKIEVKRNDVKISFDAEDYLSYEIHRHFGKRVLLIDNIKNKNGEVISYDKNIPANKYVEYSIIPYFYNQFGNKVEGITTKSDKIYIGKDKTKKSSKKRKRILDDDFEKDFDKIFDDLEELFD